jgi:hypothetical protein
MSCTRTKITTIFCTKVILQTDLYFYYIISASKTLWGTFIQCIPGHSLRIHFIFTGFQPIWCQNAVQPLMAEMRYKRKISFISKFRIGFTFYLSTLQESGKKTVFPQYSRCFRTCANLVLEGQRVDQKSHDSALCCRESLVLAWIQK